MRLDAKQLRITKPTQDRLDQLQHWPVYLILDNVLDTYNIGSIFRLADAIGATEVILCHGCETPPNSRIHKAAVGTEEWVKWRYFETAKEAIVTLKNEIPDITVVAVEQDGRSVPLDSLARFEKLAIVVGHETVGVSPEALDAADIIAEMPMRGINKSLNVHVSASIAAYKLIRY